MSMSEFQPYFMKMEGLDLLYDFCIDHLDQRVIYDVGKQYFMEPTWYCDMDRRVILKNYQSFHGKELGSKTQADHYYYEYYIAFIEREGKYEVESFMGRREDGKDYRMEWGESIRDWEKELILQGVLVRNRIQWNFGPEQKLEYNNRIQAYLDDLWIIQENRRRGDRFREVRKTSAVMTSLLEQIDHYNKRNQIQAKVGYKEFHNEKTDFRGYEILVSVGNLNRFTKMHLKHAYQDIARNNMPEKAVFKILVQ